MGSLLSCAVLLASHSPVNQPHIKYSNKSSSHIPLPFYPIRLLFCFKLFKTFTDSIWVIIWSQWSVYSNYLIVIPWQPVISTLLSSFALNMLSKYCFYHSHTSFFSVNILDSPKLSHSVSHFLHFSTFATTSGKISILPEIFTQTLPHLTLVFLLVTCTAFSLAPALHTYTLHKYAYFCSAAIAGNAFSFR